jgi:hypothetical protein
MKYSKTLTKLSVATLTVVSSFCLVSSVDAMGQGKKAHSSRPGERDPFVRWKPPAPVKRAAAGEVLPPSVQERIARYKSLKTAAMAAQQPVPKPTTALLLSEMQVTGIFRTPRGYAAMIEATPIKLSYVIYPGEQFFDGQLVAIEEDKLIFRGEKRFADGKRSFAVVSKPLRAANVISDSMTAAKSQGASAQETQASETGSKAASPDKN